MKFSDLLRMSASNLLRRKLRTVLTVFGVLIGTASIVVMISLGLGLQKSSLEQIEQYGGLTTIDVYNWTDYYSSSGTDTDALIDDEVVEAIGAIPHVEVASPI
ncbi:MAG: ABC transporter permease [Lachnospiraceae bacterium]|nr:ABC transporter permease [Lachnospiraceae bacterium]